MSTKEETPRSSSKLENGGDLEAFQPSPPAVRLDDKAATLENELQDLKVRTNRERFIFSFVIVILSSALVGPHLPTLVLLFFLLAVSILLISLGEYWDFPWAVGPMKRWMDLAYRAFERKYLGKDPEAPKGIEPPPDS